MRIGLLSDTHGYLDPDLMNHFSRCDEIWHAGDIGDFKIIEKLEDLAPVQAVYGNIDDRRITSSLPEDLRFDREEMKVFMTHIGGYPGKYESRIKEMMDRDPPDIFVCGHSHILKVIYDQKFGVLHMNPGACGHQGLHVLRTAIRFEINQGRVENAEIIELGRRGRSR